MYDNTKKHKENVLNQRDGKSGEMSMGLTHASQGRINRYTPQSQQLKLNPSTCQEPTPDLRKILASKTSLAYASTAPELVFLILTRKTHDD